jgi:serine/threonine protein kinase
MGRSFGNYELIELLGQGGMGQVWRARHAMLRREAAVKLIRPSVIGSAGAGADPETLHRRLEREARATSALSSPHTVDLFDYGMAEDGTFYYAMELLDGVDLQTLVERTGPLPPRRAVHLLVQVCESLAEAHHRGLVHRDVKPANVFCCRVGLRVDFAKVLDFGLVRLVDDDDTQLTAEGVTAGSPAYMPPEVIRGLEADHRADVYAFGGLACWLLTGELLFPGRSSLQMVLGHIEQQPRSMAERVDGVPPELDRLVLSCLEKAPDDRPGDLRRLGRELAASVDSPWTEDESEAWWQANSPDRSWGRPAELEEPGRAIRTEVNTPPPGTPEIITVDYETVPPDPKTLKAAKKQTVEALRSHFARSHISFDVFDDRSAKALRATDLRELDALMVDLPGGEPPPKAQVGKPMPATQPEPAALAVQGDQLPAHGHGQLPVPTRRNRFVSVFNTTKRFGNWTAPDRETKIVSVFGETRLDFRDVALPPGPTHLHCVSVFGSTKIIVPPELFVQVDGTAFLGEFGDVGSSTPPGPEDGWLRVTGVAVMGEVTVKVKKPDQPGLLARAIGTLVEMAVPVEHRRKALPPPEEGGSEE